MFIYSIKNCCVDYVQNSLLDIKQGERRECYNLTLVGYAPYDNLEVVFSVVVPWVINDKFGINSNIEKEVLDAYFD